MESETDKLLKMLTKKGVKIKSKALKRVLRQGALDKLDVFERFESPGKEPRTGPLLGLRTSFGDLFPKEIDCAAPLACLCERYYTLSTSGATPITCLSYFI